MLKNIPKNISPQLIKILMEMGHGDEIVIADGNFPSASMAQNLVRCDGLGVPELLQSILTLFPLDTFVEHPVSLMEVVDKTASEPPIWSEFKQIIAKEAGAEFKLIEVERHAFYEQAKKAYAVIATGEEALYANIILKKGVVI